MKGLLLSNGDIVVGQQGLVTVSGQEKVVQDMVVATKEPYGSNPFHPGWGSYMQSFVGQDAQTAPALAQTEVVRLVNNYMTVQSYIHQQAIANGGKSPYTNDDWVTGLVDMTVSQDTESLTISATLGTAAGATVGISTVVAG